MSENRNPELCVAFIKTAKAFLTAYPNVEHTWSIDDDEDHCILEIPKKIESGFDIVAKVFPKEIVIFTNGAHFHIDEQDETKSVVDSTVGLIQDLLSPHMRLRELRSNGFAYRWYLEAWNGEKWWPEDEYGYFLWNYFGKKSERIYQNSLLKGRLVEMGSDN